MRIKDWTVGELVAYLTGNQIVKPCIPILDEWLDRSLQGDKGLISGEFEIRANTNNKRKDNKND